MKTCEKISLALLAAGLASGCATPLDMERNVPPPAPAPPVVEAPPVEELDDAVVTTRVQSVLARDDVLRPYDIAVATDDGTVTLVGDVRSLALRRRATAIVQEVDGVRAVDNRLVITG